MYVSDVFYVFCKINVLMINKVYCQLIDEIMLSMY